MTAFRSVPAWFLSAKDFSGEECLIWPFAKDKGGYGHFSMNGKFVQANREMCKQVHGEPPTPKHQAAHSCGNSSCVNHRHLSWKTPKDNSNDKRSHGTMLMGESSTNVKLKESDVDAIRKANGRVEDIAAEYSISTATVSQVRKRRTWRHVP